MKSRNYVYDYEITRKRKFWNGLETFVNYAILTTVCVVVLATIYVVS